METVGPSATVPGIVVDIEPRPAFAHSRFEMKNNRYKELAKATRATGKDGKKTPKETLRSLNVKVLGRGMSMDNVYRRVSRGNGSHALNAALRNHLAALLDASPYFPFLISQLF